MEKPISIKVKIATYYKMNKAIKIEQHKTFNTQKEVEELREELKKELKVKKVYFECELKYKEALHEKR